MFSAVFTDTNTTKTCDKTDTYCLIQDTSCKILFVINSIYILCCVRLFSLSGLCPWITLFWFPLKSWFLDFSWTLSQYWFQWFVSKHMAWHLFYYDPHSDNIVRCTNEISSIKTMFACFWRFYARFKDIGSLHYLFKPVDSEEMYLCLPIKKNICPPIITIQAINRPSPNNSSCI